MLFQGKKVFAETPKSPWKKSLFTVTGRIAEPAPNKLQVEERNDDSTNVNTVDESKSAVEVTAN